MARFKITLFKSNIRKDGSCPVCLRVAKEDKTKYIDLQLSATKGQWDEQASRFKKDKRVNPNYENYNALLNRYEVRKDEILQKFMEEPPAQPAAPGRGGALSAGAEWFLRWSWSASLLSAVYATRWAVARPPARAGICATGGCAIGGGCGPVFLLEWL